MSGKLPELSIFFKYTSTSLFTGGTFYSNLGSRVEQFKTGFTVLYGNSDFSVRASTRYFYLLKMVDGTS
jgi:hypothetical protein